MDDLKRMAVFAAVVRHGSMSGAARSLSMSTSAVSQQVRLLEQGSGVTLLHRSTRKLTLTDAGSRFAEHCHAVVAASERAREQLAAAHDAPSGELRMSAPVGFARHVARALAPLLAAHPALKLRLVVDDAMIDLIDARIDLAVRGGRLSDSNWVAQRLCGIQGVLCASPEYLSRHGVPGSPEELPAHQWMAVLREGSAYGFELTGPGGDTRSPRMETRISSNNMVSLQQMCEAGLGLALLPATDVDEELRIGRLVRVLPAWQSAGFPIWAVTPQRDTQPAKVRHAIAALRSHLVTVPGVMVGQAG